MQAHPHSSLLEPDESLPAFFARIAARHQTRIAFGNGDWQPTYSALDAAANHTAHKLIEYGLNRGDRVAILMQHGAPLIGAMLAALKAGGVVVVLNPADPPARLSQILAIAEATIILTDPDLRSHAESVLGPGGRVVAFDAANGNLAASDPHISIHPDATAFLVFTSGSTGMPKAVMQTHRQVLQKVGRLFDGIDVSADDRIALLAALSGGQGIGTAWCALTTGAMLCIYPVAERGFAGMAAWMNSEGITVYLSSASLFRNLIKTLPQGMIFPSVRAVMIASEPASADDFRCFREHFAKTCKFVHMLSSSETGNIARLFLSHGDTVAEGTLPVGFPAPGIEIDIVDARGNPASPGESGEIVVRSRFLSAGYWRDPELTKERFSGNPESGGVCSFRGGDLGRINRAGQLEFLGRNDSRLKIRGYRIDPGEIERELLALPTVERAAVGVQQRTGKEPILVAQIVLRAGSDRHSAPIRRALLAKLPRHQVPSLFHFVESLPLTAHGKIAREKLGDVPERSPEEFSEPSSETEKLLAGSWAEALDCGPVGRGDDFFELGGDSLIAAVVAAKLHAKLGVELGLGQFIDHPVLADLAEVVDQMSVSPNAIALPTLSRYVGPGLPPLSYLQERVWNASRTVETSARFTVARSYQLNGSLDPALLRDAIGDVVQRHTILRTTFEERDGRPVQVVHSQLAVPVSYFDLSNKEDAAPGAGETLRHAAASIFDLSKPPLLHFTLIRLSGEEYRLLRVSHGILADGWSWQVFLRDLARAYDARVQGDTPLPTEAPLQFADYAAWQRRVFDTGGPILGHTMNWWKTFLKDSPRPGPLPYRRPKRTAAAASEGVAHFRLPADVSSRLDEIGRAEGATFYAIGVAVFAALISAEAGQADVTFGAFVTRRNRVELQEMMGLFGNQVRLRFQSSERETFREWLARVRQIVVETEAHAQIPYEQLLSCLERSGQPLHPLPAFINVFQFAPAHHFQHFAVRELDWQTEFMPSAFVLNLGQYNEADSRLTFDATYYNPARVRLFVQRLGRLFDAVSRNPDRTMKESLSMCGALRPSSLQRLTRGFVRALTGKRPAQRNSKRGTSLT